MRFYEILARASCSACDRGCALISAKRFDICLEGLAGSAALGIGSAGSWRNFLEEELPSAQGLD
jgi:hypothetical protein